MLRPFCLRHIIIADGNTVAVLLIDFRAVREELIFIDNKSKGKEAIHQ